MSRNITIPFSVFSKVIELLDCWDVSDYSLSTQEDYFDVLFALRKKQQSIELRNAYAQIITADSPDERHDARMQYLQQKRQKYSNSF
jgi:D-lyxose ketol-isomerase